MANCMCETEFPSTISMKKGSFVQSKLRTCVDYAASRSEFVGDLKYGSAAGRRVSDLKTYQIAFIVAVGTIFSFLMIL